jgi:hypothetical protein
MADAVFRCVLTNDRVFSTANPYEVDAEDDLAFCVRCSFKDGLDALTEEAGRPSQNNVAAEQPQPDGDLLPLSAVDVVRWAGLRHLPLDRPGFVKRWQRYSSALQQHLSDAGEEEKAEQLALKGQLFAKKILRMFDEVDFLVGSSADPRSCLAVLHYRDDCITPHLWVLVDGVRAEGQISGEAPDSG